MATQNSFVLAADLVVRVDSKQLSPEGQTKKAPRALNLLLQPQNICGCNNSKFQLAEF